MSISGSLCLVTGAGGFIGSHLVEHLITQGARVRAMVHYNSLGSYGWLESLQDDASVEIILGDVTDRDSVDTCMVGVDYVFHLAALIAIPYSYTAPESYVRTNVMGTLNVCQSARKARVRRLVHTSTSEVYGTAQTVPINETHPLRGQSPYSASKIGADKIAESMHLSFDLPVVTVRPFNTFGPRQSARAVIPTIISQYLSASEIRLGSLTPTRDMNYVADTVRGFAMAAVADGVEGRTINLGSGREIGIGELANLIGALMGCETTLETDEHRLRPDNSEVERLLADNQLAGSLLGWQPKVTLEEGLGLTIQWMRQHLNKYKPHMYTV